MNSFSSSTSPDFLEKLRAETRPYHDALEGLPFARMIHEGGLTETAYRETLARYYGIVVPLTLALYGEKASRLGTHLEEDLAALGLSAKEITGLPIFNALPSYTEEVQKLGGRYVLEGSALGGLLISKKVRTAFGWKEGFATKYFTGNGKETAISWKDFLESLNSFVQKDPVAQPKLIQSAIGTFRSFHSWLSYV